MARKRGRRKIHNSHVTQGSIKSFRHAGTVGKGTLRKGSRKRGSSKY